MWEQGGMWRAVVTEEDVSSEVYIYVFIYLEREKTIERILFRVCVEETKKSIYIIYIVYVVDLVDVGIDVGTGGMWRAVVTEEDVSTEVYIYMCVYIGKYIDIRENIVGCERKKEVNVVELILSYFMMNISKLFRFISK